MQGNLLTEIQMQLGSLSFENLVEKLITKEIETLNYSGTTNVNDKKSLPKQKKQSKNTKKSTSKSKHKSTRFL